MAQYNIGPKIGIEGEKEFRAQISRINKEYSAMESYTKAVSTAMEQQGKSQELLASKSNSLRQQINLQQQKLEELYKALTKAKENFDENSQEVLRFEGAILDVKNTTAALQRELDATDDELRRMAAGIEDVGDAAEVADDKVLSFGDVLKAGIASGAILNGLERVGDLILDIGGQAIEAAADVNAANAQFEQTFGALEDSARSALERIGNDTGVATTRLQGAYTSLYAFTKSVGGDSTAALNIAQRAMYATADSAAYYDRSLEDVTESLQSFLKGNYENDAALGIAATETTRNAKANELYAKSFNELTEAQKVDTLLAMVEAGNAASGALGQAAREADSWANVTGELANTWNLLLANLGSPVLEGLAPILAGINEQLNNLMEPRPIDELNAGISDFRDGIADAGEALNKANSQTAAQAELAQRYAERLRRIEGAGLDTAEAQREYAQTVELLNALMPELGLTINEVTGRLDQNTWTIEQNIDALKRQAEQQAQLAYQQDVLASYTQAYEDQYAAEKALIELQEAAVPLKQRQAAAETAYQAALHGSTEDLASARKELILANGDVRINEERQSDLIDALAELGVELDKNAALLDETASGHDTCGAAASEQAEQLAGLEQAYSAAQNAARKSIQDQIGLFDELAATNEYSAEKIIENWKRQEQAFDNYSANLQKAVDMGLDEALVQKLSDGSEQSMMILDALVNDTEISIDEINAAFGGRLSAEESLLETLSMMELAANDTYASMIAAARRAGYDTMDGIINAIYDRTPRLERAMENAARKAPVAFNRTIEINSPSRVMARSGEWTILGAVQGVESETPTLERAMSLAAKSANDAYLREQLDIAAAYPSYYAGAAAGNGTVQHVRTNNLGGLSINVYAAEGQDAHSIAHAVVDIISQQFGELEVSF